MRGDSGFIQAEGDRGPWMQTHSGLHVHLCGPTPREIRLLDIAHALSRLARFNGHTYGPHPYSVAQHCVWVAEELPKEYALWGLLHDAHEAYIGDITTPVALALTADSGHNRSVVFDLKRRVQRAIHEKFALPWPLPLKAAARIHGADQDALDFERMMLLDGAYTGMALPPDEAKRLFLQVFWWSGGYGRAWA